jgi:hypothetical protein
MTFEARFPGICANECGTRIQAGDSIVFLDGEYAHAVCARAAEKRPTCTTCFMEIAMNGACTC